MPTSFLYLLARKLRKRPQALSNTAPDPRAAALVAQFEQHPPLTQPLHAKHMAALTTALGITPHHEGITNTTRLHGYISAIVWGPQPMPLDRWLPHLLSDALGTPNTPGDTDPQQNFLALLRQLHNSVCTDLLKESPRFVAGPLKPPGFAVPLDVAEWCAGHVCAWELHPQHWSRLHPEHEDSIAHLMWLLGSEDGRRAHQHIVCSSYRDQGYEGEDAQHMTTRFFLLPSTRQHMVSQLKQDLLRMRDHWHGIKA